MTSFGIPSRTTGKTSWKGERHKNIVSQVKLHDAEAVCVFSEFDLKPRLRF